MPDESDDSRMPLWEHLDELRTILIRCLLAIGLGLCVTWGYAEQIVRFLERPLLDLLPEGEQHLYFTGIGDKFFVYLKVSMLAAVVLTSPFLIYQLWIFVSPALYRREKKFFLPFITFGTLSFFAGMLFAYYVIIPFGYKFLIDFGSDTDKAIITLTEYFDLTVKLMLGMGLLFELPVVMMLLAKFGVVTAEFLRQHRRHALVANAFLSAVITPTPDAFTLVLMMGPVALLYETSIVAVSWVQRLNRSNEMSAANEPTVEHHSEHGQP